MYIKVGQMLRNVQLAAQFYSETVLGNPVVILNGNLPMKQNASVSSSWSALLSWISDDGNVNSFPPVHVGNPENKQKLY